MRYSPQAAKACETLRKKEAKEYQERLAAEKAYNDKVESETKFAEERGMSALAKYTQLEGVSDEDHLLDIFMNP